MADVEDDVVEVDPATTFIVQSGTIQAGWAAAGNRATYWNGVAELAAAISTHSPMSTVFSEETTEEYGRCFIIEYHTDFPVFRIRIYDENHDNESQAPSFVFRIEMGNSSYIELKNIIATTQVHPFYWAIYKSNYTAGSGESASTSGDIGLVVGLDTVNAAPPQGATTQQINNLLSKYTRFAFCITEAIDSIRNVRGIPAIIVPKADNMFVHSTTQAGERGWVDDNTTEIGKKINVEFTCTGLEFDYEDTIWTPGRSAVITPDCLYYPPASNSESSIRPVKTSQAASLEYIAAMWAPITRCVTAFTLGTVWGGTLPEDTESGTDRYYDGPRYISLGSRYFLRCCDIYIPVEEIDPTENT